MHIWLENLSTGDGKSMYLWNCADLDKTGLKQEIWKLSMENLTLK